MKYFLLAGEASGDNLGGLLIEHIRALDPAASFAFFGGDEMAKASGLSPKRHIRELAFMGFVEIVRNLPTIWKLLREAKETIAEFEPDVLVCIDYPGFNLRMAKWARAQGIWVDFYVSPQIWAWRQNRVHRIAASTDRILSVLPFEQAFYASFGYEIDYVGHPLPSRIDAFVRPARLSFLSGREWQPGHQRILALLPGSRAQEIKQLLPVFVQAVAELRADHPDEDLLAVVAASPVLTDEELGELHTSYNIESVRSAYGLLSHAHVACVASGTATLETALFGVPEVVCYRGNAVSVAVARRIIHVKYISLVNLILEREVVPELIQADCSSQTIAAEVAALLDDAEREAQLTAFESLRDELRPYEATARAAKLIVERARASSQR